MFCLLPLHVLGLAYMLLCFLFDPHLFCYAWLGCSCVTVPSLVGMTDYLSLAIADLRSIASIVTCCSCTSTTS